MNSAHELGALLDALRGLRREGRTDAALATLTRTRGSTFRRPGTRMLVFGDGRLVCELSGGCPQRDIVARAREAIADGEPRIVRYNAESGLDVLMEMGCGGELEVLVEPVSATHATDYAEALAGCLQQRRSALLATVFAIDGEVVVPKRLLWCGGSPCHDDLDDPLLSREILAATEAGGPSRASAWRLPCAQGQADVLVEPVAPAHRLVVVGSSAVARALLPLAAALGWHSLVVDQDPQRLDGLPPRQPATSAGPAAIRDAVALDAHSSVVVMTHNLEQDIAYLAALASAPLAYLGALGSRERVGHMRAEPGLAGIRMHAPAGLDIGSETPEEIALAVAAEIMAVLNGRNGGPLHGNAGAIH